MSFCAACGNRLPDRARFCPGCGAPVAAPVPDDPDAVPPAPPELSGPAWSVPLWARGEWALAVACAFALLLGLFAAGALHGALLGFAALGSGGLGLGALGGAYIPFVALGGDTSVMVVGNGGDRLFLAGSALMIGWLVIPAGLTWRVLRFGLQRVRGTAAARAFVGKLALVVAVGFGVAGGLAGTGDVNDRFSDEGFRVVADVGAGESGFWLVAGVVAFGTRALARVGVPGLAAGAAGRRRLADWSRTWGRIVARGALAWGSLVAAFGLALALVAVVFADSTAERVLALEAAPALVVNAGVVGAAVLSGASAETAAVVELPVDIDGGERSLSLFHFDFPPGDDSDPAPPYLFAGVLLVPALVAFTTRRALQASDPPGEQEALRVAFAVTAGFVAAAWLGAVLAPLAAVGGALGDDAQVLRSAVARPSVGGTAGLALVWGLAASLGTALTWSRSRTAPSPPAAAAPPPPPPPPVDPLDLPEPPF